MTTPYTYCLIRYVHDKVTGEFVNVGVLLHVPETGFLRARCSTSTARLRRMFGRVDSEHIRDVLQYIERRAHNLSAEPSTRRLFGEGTAAAYAAKILPPDDSALQITLIGGGVTNDPSRELELIFERYVNHYAHGKPKTTRQDEDVLPLFRKPLEERRLIRHVQPKLIAAPDYEHEFPLAWKNGVWNACDAVSFDLKDGADIIEKANKWIGRARNLSESDEEFRLVLLVGEPRRPELLEVSHTAEKILRKAEGNVVLILEREAQRLADMVERDLAR